MAPSEPAAPSYEVSALSVVHNPWVMGVAAMPFLLCLLAIAAALTVQPAIGVFALHGGLLGAVTTVYAWGRNPWPRTPSVAVRVDEHALTVGNRRVRRADIRAGTIVAGDGYVTVQLARRGLRPAVQVRLPTEEDGRELLRALGLGATQAVGRFRAMSRVHKSEWHTTGAVLGTMAGGGLATAGLAALLGPWVAAPAMGLTILVLGVLLLAPTRVDVGADGVLLRWLGRERFVPHDQIRRTSARIRGWGRSRRWSVELELASDEHLSIPTGPSTFDFGRAQGLEERIRAAQQAWAGGESVHAEALLRRGKRSHVEWVAALRHANETATLRSAPLQPERLWRIVEDPKMPSLERAAAAVALQPELGGDDRLRLERAAAAVAAPRLRIALDAVAQRAEDRAVADALAELEDENAADRQQRR